MFRSLSVEGGFGLLLVGLDLNKFRLNQTNKNLDW